jgi:predicted enzyme related to lactoylglutathione lyase
MNGPAVVQFEITGKDSAALQRFYARLFDWEIHQTGTPSYGRIRAAENSIPGAIGASWDGGAGLATVLVEVANLQETLVRAKELGGQVMSARHEVPQAGVSFAYVADPEGHVIGLAQGLQRSNERFWGDGDRDSDIAPMSMMAGGRR